MIRDVSASLISRMMLISTSRYRTCGHRGPWPILSFKSCFTACSNTFWMFGSNILELPPLAQWPWQWHMGGSGVSMALLLIPPWQQYPWSPHFTHFCPSCQTAHGTCPPLPPIYTLTWMGILSAHSIKDVCWEPVRVWIPKPLPDPFLAQDRWHGCKFSYKTEKQQMCG